MKSKKTKPTPKPRRLAKPALAEPAPMVSIAGIRGVVGESLRLEEFLAYAQAYMARLTPRSLVVGSDTRLSREMMRHLVFAAAIGSGVRVHDLGIVPTPTVGLMVRELGAGGGIVISASHNPGQWNALKFFSASGSFLTPERFEELVDDCDRKRFHRARIDEIGSVEPVLDPIGPHLAALLTALPVRSIRRRKFRVVLDACNGAGVEISQELFKALGVELGAIHVDQDRGFERVAEPLPRNLKRLAKAVVKFKADIGFAIDPDADRLAIVDETGRPIGEERTLTLAADYVLAKTPGPIVTNLSTTRAIDDVAARHGVSVHRTPIGEAHVVGKMEAVGSPIGGEGNGGVILPGVHPGRDSATGMGLILALMTVARRGKPKATLSEINAAIPDYVMIKDKLDLPDRAAAAPSLKRLAAKSKELGDDVKLDRADGLKISLPDSWLHVRASGTEPILRLYAEAPKGRAARALVDWGKQVVSAKH